MGFKGLRRNLLILGGGGGKIMRMLRFIRVKPAREVSQNHNVIDEKQFPLKRIALTLSLSQDQKM